LFVCLLFVLFLYALLGLCYPANLQLKTAQACKPAHEAASQLASAAKDVTMVVAAMLFLKQPANLQLKRAQWSKPAHEAASQLASAAKDATMVVATMLFMKKRLQRPFL